MVIVILFSLSLVMAEAIFNGEEDMVILDVVLEAVMLVAPTVVEANSTFGSTNRS